MKWTEEQTIRFVREFIKYECLYNINCTEHRKKRLRDAALLKLSSSLGIPDFGPKDAYHKIRSLKSTYFQELKKIKKSRRSGASSVYKPNLKWFNILHDSLMAVSCTGQCRDTTNHFQTVSVPEFQQKIEVPLENDMEHENYTSSAEENSSPGADDHPQIHTGSADIYSPPAEAHHLANAAHEPEQFENEFDIFGKSVAVQLNNMPLDTAIEAQAYIQNYISDVRLRALRRPSPAELNYKVQVNAFASNLNT